MTEKVKSFLSFFARMGLSALLLFLVFRQIEWVEVKDAFLTADMGLLAAAFAIHALLQVVILIRWIIFMRALSLKTSMWQVVRFFFIGLFCNLFLPSAIGGDLVKAYGLSRGVGDQKAKVYASVLLDRLSGFAGVAIVGILAYIVGFRMITDPGVIIAVMFLGVFAISIVLVLFNEKVYTFFCGIFKPFPRLHGALIKMHYDVVLMKGKQKEGWSCVGISFVLQLLCGVMYYWIALSVGVHVDLLFWLVFTPIVVAVSFLPSIGGLGFREFGWVYLLAQVGVDKSLAASISLLSFVFIIIVGLVGGIFYVATLSRGRLQCDPKGSSSSE